jgi:hypothetical protein
MSSSQRRTSPIPYARGAIRIQKTAVLVQGGSFMKIDIFTHVMLPRYKQALYKHADKFRTEKAVQDRRPVLTDYEARLRKIEPYPNV